MEIKPSYLTLPPLSLHPTDKSNRFLTTYLSFYGLQFPFQNHHIGVLHTESSDTIVVQIFRPINSIGTILLSHGLFDHGASFKHVINCCLDLHYTVVVFDYPGHGLSSGTLMLYSDFKLYADALKCVLDFCKESLSPPFHLAGHSTGCSSIVELLYTFPSDAREISSILFLAPLIRPVFWHLSQIAFRILHNRISAIPRIYHSISSERAFVDFYKNDPLQARKLPLKWVHALLMWNKRMNNRGPMDTSISIIQGKSDQVVAWKFNLPFLENRFKIKTDLIPNAMHHIHNECYTLRSKTLFLIKKHLEEFS